MKIEIKYKEIFLYFVLLLYLKPINVTLIPTLNMIYKVLKIVATLAIGLAICRYKIKLTKAAKYCCCFLVVWAISTLLNTKSVGSIAQDILSILGIILLCSYCVVQSKGVNNLLCALGNISRIYIVLNFLTVVMDKPLFAQPEIYYVKYFLGSDNYTAFILIPLCGFMFASDFLKRNKVRIQSWFIGFLGFLSLLIPFAVSGAAAYAFFLMGVLFINYPKIRKILSVKNVVICLGLLLVFILNPTIQEFFATVSIVGKRGLNSREVIWPMAVQAIQKRPILGYGVLTQQQTDSYILYGVSHTHSIFLEFLMKAGVLGSIFVFLWSYFTFKDCFKVKEKAMYCMLFCVGAYVICGFFDFYIGLIYFWLMILLIDSYVTQRKKEEQSLRNNNL